MIKQLLKHHLENDVRKLIKFIFWFGADPFLTFCVNAPESRTFINHYVDNHMLLSDQFRCFNDHVFGNNQYERPERCNKLTNH